MSASTAPICHVVPPPSLALGETPSASSSSLPLLPVVPPDPPLVVADPPVVVAPPTVVAAPPAVVVAPPAVVVAAPAVVLVDLESLPHAAIAGPASAAAPKYPKRRSSTRRETPSPAEPWSVVDIVPPLPSMPPRAP